MSDANLISWGKRSVTKTDFVPLTVTSAGLLQEPPSDDLTRTCATEQNPIAAVLVFSDPSNWYIDLQLMYDLYTSGHSNPTPVCACPHISSY